MHAHGCTNTQGERGRWKEDLQHACVTADALLTASTHNGQNHRKQDNGLMLCLWRPPYPNAVSFGAGLLRMSTKDRVWWHRTIEPVRRAWFQTDLLELKVKSVFTPDSFWQAVEMEKKRLFCSIVPLLHSLLFFSTCLSSTLVMVKENKRHVQAIFLFYFSFQRDKQTRQAPALLARLWISIHLTSRWAVLEQSMRCNRSSPPECLLLSLILIVINGWVHCDLLGLGIKAFLHGVFDVKGFMQD